MDEIRIILYIQKIPNVPNNQKIPNNPNIPNNQITQIIQVMHKEKGLRPNRHSPYSICKRTLFNSKLDVDIDGKQFVDLLIAILHSNIMRMAAFAMAIISSHSAIP